MSLTSSRTVATKEVRSLTLGACTSSLRGGNSGDGRRTSIGGTDLEVDAAEGALGGGTERWSSARDSGR